MKTKIYIVTGFLGAGKTTLLKRILAATTDLHKTVVLVNEFGSVGIDTALIKSSSPVEIVELTSGCICCSLKTDMIQTLQILHHDFSPEQIVIEATGVADPLSIIEVLGDRLLAPHFCLEKTITVVDHDCWEARQAFGTVFESQLNQADIILVNKIDTCDPSELSHTLGEIKQEGFKGSIIPTLHCNIDPDIFWSCPAPEARMGLPAGLPAENPDRSPFKPYDPVNDIYSPLNGQGALAPKENRFMTFSFEHPGAMDKDRFLKFLEAQPLELFRIKGPVKFSDQTQMLNYVGGKSNWQQWPDMTTTRLAFIGWGVIEEQILNQLTRCLISA